MKLEQATALASLRMFAEPVVRDKTKTAQELAHELFAEAEQAERPFLYLTEDKWAKRWLPSKKFKLVRLPLNAVALPCNPKGPELVLKKLHAREEKPIICDYNKNQVGKSLNGFTPQIIVIDGKHRFQAAQLRGESHIMAWVGEVAISEMDAATERHNKRFGVKAKKDCGCGCGGKCKDDVKAFSGGSGGGPDPATQQKANGAQLVARGLHIKHSRTMKMIPHGEGHHSGASGLHKVTHSKSGMPHTGSGTFHKPKHAKIGLHGEAGVIKEMDVTKLLRKKKEK